MKNIFRLRENVVTINNGINAIIDGYINSQVKTLEDIAGLDPEMVSILKTYAELMRASEEMLEDTVEVYSEILSNQEKIMDSLSKLEAKMA